MNAEQTRLQEAKEPLTALKKWGPYLSERQWGTVREDYSEGGNAWDYFSHNQARSRAYRWGEDGLAGISDDQQHFTWWVNRKDRTGRNVFEGGFLGLDNIGVFDRSSPLPTGGYLEQADGTAWLALFSQNMLQISAELAMSDPDYADMALKFVEHFLWIASSMTHVAVVSAECLRNRPQVEATVTGDK